MEYDKGVLKYIPNDDKQNYFSCRSELFADKFGHF